MATIQGVYVALFGRPADPAGLAFFNELTGNGANLQPIVGALTATAEFQARFAGQSDSEIINSIYQSLFDRDAEPAGLQFFLDGLADGTFTIETIAIAILDGAQNEDLALLTLKLDAAALFTARLDLEIEVEAYVGNSAAGIGRDFLDSINADNPATNENTDAAILRLFGNEGQEPGGGGAPGGGNPPAPVYDVNFPGTIQAAVDAAEPGATITVGPGTYIEDVNIPKNIKIIFTSGTTLDGGFAVAGVVDTFTIQGGTISGGLKAGVDGVSSFAEVNLGIYAQGESQVTVNNVSFVDTASESGSDMRGLAGNTGQDAQFIVENSSFTGLLTGIYLNPGNDASVTGSTFTGNTAGIGGVGDGTNLTVSGTAFSGNIEDIGVEANQTVASFNVTPFPSILLKSYDGSGGNPITLSELLELTDVIFVGDGGSIQAAIDAAPDGATIFIGAGSYDEDLSINKPVTLLGQESGAGVIINGVHTVSASTGDLSINSINFNYDGDANTLAALLTITGDADVDISGSSFTTSKAQGNADGGGRAILVPTNYSGELTIDGNSFGGESGNKYGTADFRSAIWSDGTASQLTIIDNTFESVRSAMNLDGYDDTKSEVSGNEIANSGTGISFGLATGSSTSSVAGNTFTNVDTDLNLQNLTTDVVVDLNDNSAPDTFVVLTGFGNDTITTGSTYSIVVAGAGNDTIVVGAGGAFVTGGAGADTVTFNEGIDTFKYTAADQSAVGQMDVINSFALGQDKVEYFGAIGAQGSTGFTYFNGGFLPGSRDDTNINISLFDENGFVSDQQSVVDLPLIDARTFASLESTLGTLQLDVALKVTAVLMGSNSVGGLRYGDDTYLVQTGEQSTISSATFLSLAIGSTSMQNFAGRLADQLADNANIENVTKLVGVTDGSIQQILDGSGMMSA
jgi:hypothetical protein